MKVLLTELADDADTLARLHDRELDADTLAALKEIGFPDNLSLLPQDENAQAAWQAMRLAINAVPASGHFIPPAPTFLEIDELAAEYAAIYLTGRYGVSPCESVWLDEDRLSCREPMFALRKLYRGCGLAVRDWRKQSDDHLAIQLAFIATQLRQVAPDSVRCDAIDEILEKHILRWLASFTDKVCARATQPFYRALAQLTLGWCLSLRIVLLAWRKGLQERAREG